MASLLRQSISSGEYLALPSRSAIGTSGLAANSAPIHSAFYFPQFQTPMFAPSFSPAHLQVRSTTAKRPFFFKLDSTKFYQKSKQIESEWPAGWLWWKARNVGKNCSFAHFLLILWVSIKINHIFSYNQQTRSCTHSPLSPMPIILRFMTKCS